MMTVKRALRRAMAGYADKVNFGFMNSYQGKGIGVTNISTEIFPYVKLQSCPTSANMTETKLLTRGELEQAGCFSLTTGPTSPCTIDYGGNGAINADDTLNKISYTLVGGNDSRWAIPRGDASGKYNHVDAPWSDCASSSILPACEISGQGTGLYEGSYYYFTYKQGTPVTSGEGSRAQPKYFTTYKGKYYEEGGSCYNAVDAERTDIVNDGVYNRVAYTGNPYDSDNEVGVPWSGSTSSSECNATTGAIWNNNVVPFLTDTTFGGKSITRAQKALMTTARLEKASFGGVYATGQLAPVGCMLNNDGSQDQYHSAAHYMSTVKSTDETNNGDNTPCWSNNIILVVDGQATAPGDQGSEIDCASVECAYNASTNPTLEGCNCPAIVKAYNLAHPGSGTPVQTHVVANVPDWNGSSYTWRAYTHAFLWNLAVAGSPNFDGTPSFGTTEDEVYKGISDKIAAAAYHFTYTTTGAVPGATTQNPTSQVLTYSSYLYDTSVSYPSWKGTVRAFDVTSAVTLGWDAVSVAAAGHPSDWTGRKIFFSGTDGVVRQVTFTGSGSSGAVSSSSASALHAAGLGASDEEAGLIMAWLLGKPGLGNPAPLMGSTTSSTPIVVGQAAFTPQNGSSVYSQGTWTRPQLVYAGGDDGMLHAFFAHLGSRSWDDGATYYYGGEEAFAFIPNDMLPVIAKLYAQGGQTLAPDQGQHVFGLASSPKVKDICIGSNCEESDGSDWHTVLVMPEGRGGNRPFALDITNVIDGTNGPQPSNLSLLWSAAPKSGGWVKLPSSSDGETWDKKAGYTNSVPGFYFSGYVAGAADNRVLMASGYPTTTASGYGSQGLVLINADAATGAIKDTQDITGKASETCSAQTHTMMADIALARYYSCAGDACASTNTILSQSLMAAYAVDTWGNTYQYVPSADTKLTNLYHLGCGHPLYYAPAVVQLDRSITASTTAKNYIYLVQVTNSNLDSDTATVSETHPASLMVVTKLNGNVSPPQIVSSYNPTYNENGQIVLSADPNAPNTGTICLQSINAETGLPDNFTDGAKTWDQTCAAAGGTAFPVDARPIGTPSVVLRADGLGFQVLTGWYDATAMSNNCSSGGQFNYGTSYLTVHEFGASGAWYQIAGLALTNTVLTGVAFAGAAVFVDGMTQGAVPQSIDVGETFSTTQQLLQNSALERYTRTMWSERVEL